MREGASALFTLTVHVPAATANAAGLTNSVSVVSTTADPTPGNNGASVTTNAVTRADVAISKTGPSAPIAGTDVTYSIIATNNGPSVASNVSVADTIPAGTTFQSLTAPAGWTCAKPAAGTPGPVGVSCTTSTLQPAASATFTMTLRLGASAASGGDLCNTATVTNATQDPIAANNSSRACGAIRTVADLSLAQTATTIGKAGKGTASFAFVVTNLGPSDSQHVSLNVTSSLFKGAKVTTTASGAACTVSGQTVTCSWAGLPFGSVGQVQISVPWSSSVGQVCTTGTLSSGTPDPNAINSTATACIGKK